MKWRTDLLQPGSRFAKLQSIATISERMSGQGVVEWEVVSVHHVADGIPLVKLKSLRDHSQLKTLSAMTLCDRKMYRPTWVPESVD